MKMITRLAASLSLVALSFSMFACETAPTAGGKPACCATENCCAVAAKAGKKCEQKCCVDAAKAGTACKMCTKA